VHHEDQGIGCDLYTVRIFQQPCLLLTKAAVMNDFAWISTSLLIIHQHFQSHKWALKHFPRSP
jgi:hypothetical protein